MVSIYVIANKISLESPQNNLNYGFKDINPELIKFIQKEHAELKTREEKNAFRQGWIDTLLYFPTWDIEQQKTLAEIGRRLWLKIGITLNHRSYGYLITPSSLKGLERLSKEIEEQTNGLQGLYKLGAHIVETHLKQKKFLDEILY